MNIEIGDLITYTDLLHPSNTNHKNKYFVLEMKKSSNLEILKNVSYKIIHLDNYKIEYIKVWEHNNGFEYQIHLEERNWNNYMNWWYIWLFYI